MKARWIAYRLVAALFLAGQLSARAVAPLSVVRALETVRFMRLTESLSPETAGGRVSVSPLGTSFVVGLLHGSITQNGITLELLVGHPDSLVNATKLRSVARLFTTGLGSGFAGNFGPNDDTKDFQRRLQWVGEDKVSLIWSDRNGRRQVFLITLSTQQMVALTDHDTTVDSFGIGLDDTILFNAATSMSRTSFADSVRQGTVVPAHSDIFSLLRDDGSGRKITESYLRRNWYIQDKTGCVAMHIGGRAEDPSPVHVLVVSPDGKWALINSAPEKIPASWERYTASEEVGFIRDARRGGPGSSYAWAIQQFYLVNLKERRAFPLWDAVDVMLRTSARWSPDSAALLLAPAFLPAETDDQAGLQGEAAAVIDIRTGQYAVLPFRTAAVADLKWRDQNSVAIAVASAGNITWHTFFRQNNVWKEIHSESPSGETRARITFDLRQGLNLPPCLYVLDSKTGEERKLIDPNPTLLQDAALGKVEKREGKTSDGGEWQGLLFYPPGYTPGHAYPLVLQSIYGGKGFSDEFTLYGGQDNGGVGVPYVASYPGQILAGRGIMVLQINAPTHGKSNSPSEAEIKMHAFESAVDQLVVDGLADAHKVGLVGFSRNGFYVEYTLTHSPFPFAAAIAADNWNPSYFQTILTGNFDAAVPVIGAQPFGEGLDSWRKNATGFNYERCRTPLRLVQQSNAFAGILGSWETYSLLKYLQRPVEMYIMPDAEAHGAHNSQNPVQVLAVMQGTVDWFDFWLNGVEDADPAKAEQYLRWRVLRQLQIENARQADRKAENDPSRRK
ncbi:MAG: hypothetical protein JWM32_3132 [Verrucomicrobia bacterium]|nr:hypothetical protein [Verrucomicrobiota bacterium]